MNKLYHCIFAIHYKNNYLCGCTSKWEICKFNIEKPNCKFFIEFKTIKINGSIKPLKCCQENCIFCGNKYKPFLSMKSCRYRTNKKDCIITHQ